MKIRFFLLSIFYSCMCFGLDLTELANTYKSDKGNEYFHTHHYTRHYEALFGKDRYNIKSILEIGLNIGTSKECASLKMWIDYFPNAFIYGMDIQPQTFQHERVKILIGNSSEPAFLDKCINEFKESLDFIIDDASHVSWDQQIALIKLFKVLRPGGKYIIEDLHHQSEDPPGILKTRTFLEKISNQEPVPIPESYQEELNRIIETIDSIQFFDSARFGEKCFAVISKKAIIC